MRLREMQMVVIGNRRLGFTCKGWGALGEKETIEKAQRENLVAVGFIKQGMGELAVPHLKKALAYFTKENPHSEMIGALYNNLGSAYKTMEHWSASMKWLCRALDWALEPDHDDGVLAYTHGHLSEVFKKTGDLDTAAYHGEQSLVYCLRTQNYTRARETLATIIPIYREGEPGRAKELMDLQKAWGDPL